MLNLTSKIQTIIIYALASFLIVIISMYTWIKIENASLENEVKALEITVSKYTDAESSCSETLTTLIESDEKQKNVLKVYKSNIKDKSDDKNISNVDSFIDYANGLW
jgi:hypothetical protein